VKRTALRTKSKKRAKADRGKEPIRQAVYERDGGCLLRKWPGAGPCFGERTPHHLHKSGQQGEYSESNLVQICSSHNGGWIEDHPIEANELGLVVRAGETIEEAWAKMRKAGLTTWEPFNE
jgi:hypothetical protein